MLYIGKHWGRYLVTMIHEDWLINITTQHKKLMVWFISMKITMIHDDWLINITTQHKKFMVSFISMKITQMYCSLI